MKEYRIVEDQEELKRPKYQFNGVKKVSHLIVKETEKKEHDVLKLKQSELPVSILLKIDKLINTQLREQINPDFIKNYIKQKKEEEKKG